MARRPKKYSLEQAELHIPEDAGIMPSPTPEQKAAHQALIGLAETYMEYVETLVISRKTRKEIREDHTKGIMSLPCISLHCFKKALPGRALCQTCADKAKTQGGPGGGAENQ